MRLKYAAFLLPVILLSGCSSTMGAIYNKSLMSYNIDNPSLHAVTGERRFAVTLPKFNSNNELMKYVDPIDKKTKPLVRFCAESLPDTATAFSGSSDITIDALDHAKSTFNDEFKTTLQQTFSRTENAEIFRHMGWQMCQAWAQNVFDDKMYAEELKKLLESGRKFIETRPTTPVATQATTQTSQKP